ncbi:SDR family oxidoreductase [Luteolibacter luteus]|uniref:SDR family oxidoreductase n=1 Tax=Luteolibacter luteus TaxID=2728835 RepID=A0A858RB84_9BACT|nr:SDR family oxidoreductase [Luteolibacter luteus]QJE94246.1 SDR family oxidoreductase [Luteolibacter luteus]
MKSQSGISQEKSSTGKLSIVVIGGTGRVGTRLVKTLRAKGHEVLAASPSTGVDTITKMGLKEALIGADVVVDVTQSPSFEPKAVLEFFQQSGHHLLAAEARAGIAHHVALSVVGTDRMLESGYFRGKMAQENLITSSTVPYTIVRATQFFEFAAAIAGSATTGNEVHLPHTVLQPMSSDDLVAALAEIAIAPPQNGIVDVAGPEELHMDDFVRQFLTASGDERKVVTDAKAKYFGAVVDRHSLTPGKRALYGSTRFTDWLEHAMPKAKAAR